MAKFRYLIVDLESGVVAGTDDMEEAQNFNNSELSDFVVIDQQEGLYSSPAMDDEPIRQVGEEGEADPDADDND